MASYEKGQSLQPLRSNHQWRPISRHCSVRLRVKSKNGKHSILDNVWWNRVSFGETSRLNVSYRLTFFSLSDLFHHFPSRKSIVHNWPISRLGECIYGAFIYIFLKMVISVAQLATYWCLNSSSFHNTCLCFPPFAIYSANIMKWTIIKASS